MYQTRSIVGNSRVLEKCIETNEPEEAQQPSHQVSHRLIRGVPQLVIAFADDDRGHEEVADFMLGCKTPFKGEAPIPYGLVQEADLKLEDMECGALLHIGFDTPSVETILQHGEQERTRLVAEVMTSATVSFQSAA